MLQALERHFLTALPFLFQNLSTSSFPREKLRRVLIKRLFWNAHSRIIGYITMMKYCFKAPETMAQSVKGEDLIEYLD
jgi:hypothetical protein